VGSMTLDSLDARVRDTQRTQGWAGKSKAIKWERVISSSYRSLGLCTLQSCRGWAPNEPECPPWTV